MHFSERHHSCCAGGQKGPFALPGTERQYERARPFPIRKLALDLKLDLEKGQLRGRAVIDFERASPDGTELVLDAINFEKLSCQLKLPSGAIKPAYSYDGDQLVISIPLKAKAGQLIIRYSATPERGLYFLRPDKEVPDRPLQVWSQCQDEDARHWFPCHDKPHVKMGFSLTVEVPHGFTAISNGEPVQQSVPASKKQNWKFAYDMPGPLPSYLVTLVVGKFDRVEDRPAIVGDREIPVHYFVPEGRAKDSQRSFGETPNMIELFSQLTGTPYPWSRYSQVVVSDFVFGGMENTSCTTMYEHVMLDEKAGLDISSHDLVAHELAHQWFGDLVTCRDWSHAWLNEGFATYFEHLEKENRLGRAEYLHGVETDLNSYLNEASSRYQRPIVCRYYAEPLDLFDRHLYEKGGLLLHMLRSELGDSVFWEGVRGYLAEHRDGIVETRDLRAALENASGTSLERFFDSWAYHPGHPKVKVKVRYSRGQLVVSVHQSQKTNEVPLFDFPLEIEIRTEGGKIRRVEKQVSDSHDSLIVMLRDRPSYVAVDPELRMVGKISLDAPSDMLHSQLKHGSSERVRATAARALASRRGPSTIAALGTALSRKKEHWIVRTAAAAALGDIRGDESVRLLRAELTAKDPKVRVAVTAAIGEFRGTDNVARLTQRANKDDSYLVAAAAARALGASKHESAKKPLLSLLKKDSWASVVASGALAGLASLDDDQSIDAVLKLTQYGTPSRARRSAIMAASQLSDSPKTRKALTALLDEPDPHLRISVVQALGRMGDPKSRRVLVSHLRREQDGRVIRRIRETLRTMRDSQSAEAKRLQDELTGVKKEVVELSTRLAKLEARSTKSRSKTKTKTKTKTDSKRASKS